MAIIGSSFTKILIEKKAAPAGEIKINNNISIKEVEEANFSLGKNKQKGLKCTFRFVTNYEPKIGSMEFEGEVLALVESVEEIIKNWKKDKKLPKEIMTSVMNNVLNKCNIQALILSQTVNLPPPIPLPKVTADPNKK